MSRRRSPKQIPMFSTPPQPRLKRESALVYDAVLDLRKAGCKVSRAGRHEHFVDGRRVSTAKLFLLTRGIQP